MNSGVNFLFFAVATITALLLQLGCASVSPSPLQAAARDGDTTEITKLLDGGYDINDYGSAKPPIVWAIWRKKLDAVKLLIEKGADLEAPPESNGVTPLHYAALYSSPQLVRMLIGSGANVNAIETNKGLTPLHYAVQVGCLEAAKLLIDAGADPTISTFNGKRASDFALSGSDKRAILAMTSNIANRRQDASRTVLAPTPEPVVIPQMNAPE